MPRQAAYILTTVRKLQDKLQLEYEVNDADVMELQAALAKFHHRIIVRMAEQDLNGRDAKYEPAPRGDTSYARVNPEARTYGIPKTSVPFSFGPKEDM